MRMRMREAQSRLLDMVRQCVFAGGWSEMKGVYQGFVEKGNKVGDGRGSRRDFCLAGRGLGTRKIGEKMGVGC